MRQAVGPVGLLWIDENPSNAVQRFLQSVRVEARTLHHKARKRIDWQTAGHSRTW